jgi:TolA-binding protein
MLDAAPTQGLQFQARFWKAEATLQAGNPAEAEAEFRSLASSPDPENPWRDTARLRVIQCLNAQSRWTDVLSEADAILAEQPNFPLTAELAFARGRALQSRPLPDFKAARKAYNEAINALPGSDLAARATFMTGETFLLEGNPQQAIRAFLEVDLTYNAPNWQAAALLEAGKAYESLQKSSEAVAAYRKLLEKHPDHPGASEARNRLASLGGTESK